MKKITTNTKQNFSLKIILALLTLGLFLLYYYYGIPIFYFKFIIIIFLLSLNVYFLLTDSKTFQGDALISSFPGSNLIKRHFQTVATLGGLYATYLTIKSDGQANREKVLENIIQQAKTAQENQNSAILKLQAEKIGLSAQTGRAVEYATNSNLQLSLMRQRLKELSEIKNKKPLTDTDELRVKTLEGLVNNDLGNLKNSNDSFLKENPTFLDNNSENKLEESKTFPNSEDNEISKSFFFSGIFSKFESLDTYSKLAVSLLLSKSVLVSSLVSIAFIFYGDYLVERFNLETRFPKLYEIINLRKKFNRYYLILNITTIIIIILAEVLFSIAILNL